MNFEGKMEYVLNDGTKIDLNNIYEISDIRDCGNDESTIDESKISFTIRFKVGKSKKICLNYHYSDWFEAYKELKSIRNDIIENWEKTKDNSS